MPYKAYLIHIVIMWWLENKLWIIIEVIGCEISSHIGIFVVMHVTICTLPHRHTGTQQYSNIYVASSDSYMYT